MKTATGDPAPLGVVSGLLAAAEQQASPAGTAAQPDALARARAFAEPLIASETLDTGENTLAHADAVAAIVERLGGSHSMQAAVYLVYACAQLSRPREVIAKAFGESYAALAVETTQLVAVQRQARQAEAGTDRRAETEKVRKMLLAFSRDLRVVLLRLASRLQTLRWHAQSRTAVSPDVAKEALEVFAPLANRLGIWQLKWELEDLAFRFLEPQTYKQVAGLLEDKRAEREAHIEGLRLELQGELRAQNIQAQVQGRPKHIYSIVKKMRGKELAFDRVFDVRALRVVVQDDRACYAALAWTHQRFEAVAGEFDDYIARPKPNGYQSLHTVVRDAQGRAVEIQIRTQAMHEHAEHGVAAHWAYKDAGVKGYGGAVTASSAYDAKIAVLRQLLAWERELTGAHAALFDDRIYVLTPQATVVELAYGATAVDFAYAVHTSLGHRCRGAKVDGSMVPLQTPLKNGQTVEVVAVREGGPSRDWLNPELGFLASARARAKVRAWFNEQARHQTVARGREAVERLLQRQGRTALKLEDLATQLGLASADDLFDMVGKDELSLRAVETALRPPPELARHDEIPLRRTRQLAGPAPRSGVLVVGVDSLMTQLARCCKAAPPDAIGGFVTRGKGVSIHRADCGNFRTLSVRDPGRVIEVEWGRTSDANAVYAVDVAVEASDRQGLLRDISEVFAKEKMNVTGVQTQSVRQTAWMTFTVEISDSQRLARVLLHVADVRGVRSARRR